MKLKKIFFAFVALVFVLVSVTSCSCSEERYDEDDYVYGSDYPQSRVRVSVVKRVSRTAGRILLEDDMVLYIWFDGHDLYENQYGQKLKKKYASLFVEPGDTVFYEKTKEGVRIREIRYKD